MKQILLLLLVLIMMSCERSYDYYITFVNDSDKTVMVEYNLSYPNDSTELIRFMISSPSTHTVVNPRSSDRLTAGGVYLESWYTWFYLTQTDDAGFISFYVMDPAVVEGGDVESVLDNYDVLARYDVREEDIEELNWKITYPPTPEMAHIHMWPPYETIKAER